MRSASPDLPGTLAQGSPAESSNSLLGFHSKVMAVPSSGMRALEYVRRTSDSFRPEYILAVDHFLNAQTLFETDPHHFQAFNGKVQTSKALLTEWTSNPEHSKIVNKFCEEFKTQSDNDLIMSMENHFEYFVKIKKCSAQLAIKAMIYHYTLELRTGASDSENVLTSRGNQLVMWLLMYLIQEDADYDPKFRQNCISRTLDFSLLEDHTANTAAEQYPGYARLVIQHVDLTPQIWSFFLRDMISFIGGPLQKSKIDLKGPQTKYFTPSDVKKPSYLRFCMDACGKFTDVELWIPAENNLRLQVNQAARAQGLLASVLTDYDRVGNALRSMRATHSNDFYDEWWFQFKKSDEVPSDIVIPENGWPNISWTLMEKLMRDTQKALLRDQPRARARLQKMRTEVAKESQTQQQQSSTRGRQQQQSRCSICQSTDHATARCPNRSGEVCKYFQRFSNCRYGNRCKFEHIQGNDTKVPPDANQSAQQQTSSGASTQRQSQNAPNSQVNSPVPPQGEFRLKDYVAKPETGKQTIACRKRCHPDCQPTFEVDMSYWGVMCNRKAREGVEWNLPKSCEKCRSASQTSHMVTAEEGNPYEQYTEQHENDCGEDYGYSLSMSEMVTSVDNNSNHLDAFGCQGFAFSQHSVSKSPTEESNAVVPEGELQEFLSYVDGLLMQNTSLVSAVNTGNNCTQVVEPERSQRNELEISMEIDIPDDDQCVLNNSVEDEVPRDYARHLLRCKQNAGEPIPDELTEAVQLELDRSAIINIEPTDDKRIPIQPSTEGYVMLGDMVDRDLLTTRDDMQAILNSSIDQDEDGSDDSSGSDHQFTIQEIRDAQRRYHSMMDKDARELVRVELRVAATDVMDGELLVSTHSDVFGLCTCQKAAFDYMCTRCCQCPTCCDCYNQQQRLIQTTFYETPSEDDQDFC